LLFTIKIKLEREENKEGKYHGNATMGVGVTTAGIENTGKFQRQ